MDWVRFAMANKMDRVRFSGLRERLDRAFPNRLTRGVKWGSRPSADSGECPSTAQKLNQFILRRSDELFLVL